MMTDTHLGSRSQNRMSSFGNITQAALKASNQIKTGRKIQNVNTWNILKVVQGKLCVCDGLGKEGGKLTQALFTILWSTSCRWGESSAWGQYFHFDIMLEHFMAQNFMEET